MPRAQSGSTPPPWPWPWPRRRFTAAWWRHRQSLALPAPSRLTRALDAQHPRLQTRYAARDFRAPSGWLADIRTCTCRRSSVQNFRRHAAPQSDRVCLSPDPVECLGQLTIVYPQVARTQKHNWPWTPVPNGVPVKGFEPPKPEGTWFTARPTLQRLAHRHVRGEARI